MIKAVANIGPSDACVAELRGTPFGRSSEKAPSGLPQDCHQARNVAVRGPSGAASGNRKRRQHEKVPRHSLVLIGAYDSRRAWRGSATRIRLYLDGYVTAISHRRSSWQSSFSLCTKSLTLEQATGLTHIDQLGDQDMPTACGTSENLPSETFWRIGLGSKSGLRRLPLRGGKSRSAFSCPQTRNA